MQDAMKTISNISVPVRTLDDIKQMPESEIEGDLKRIFMQDPEAFQKGKKEAHAVLEFHDAALYHALAKGVNPTPQEEYWIDYACVLKEVGLFGSVCTILIIKTHSYNSYKHY